MVTKAAHAVSSASPALGLPAASGGGPLARVTIDAYVQRGLVTVAGDAPVGVVLGLLEGREISAVPVVGGDGSALGVVSRTDLLRTASAGYQSEALRGYSFERSATVASEIMHRGVIVVTPGAVIADAARCMAKHRMHRVFVEDHRGRLNGVVGMREVMSAIGEARLDVPIGAVMSRKPLTIPCEMTVGLATSRLSVAKALGLVVVDPDGWPVGLFTQREALLARNLPAKATVDEAMSRSVLFMSVDTPVHLAAARAAETLARRVLVVAKARVAGIVTPLDFARLAARSA